MYPSLNNNGNDNIQLKTPQDLYQTPSTSSFHLPSPIYNIPLEDEAAFCEFFQQQQFFSTDQNRNILADHEMSNNNGQIATTNDGDDDRCDVNTRVEQDNNSPRKIPSDRDRHSKINTARGPRDRRMRLSLDVAKRLFGLQDLLGFDKASKTVDWLITESKAAILDLLPNQNCSFMDVSNSASSTSKCEILSAMGDQFLVKNGDDDQATTKSKGKSTSGSSKKQKEKTTRVRKCVDLQNPLAKETRVRARQRARERTIQKQKDYNHGVGQDSTFIPFLDQVLDQDANQLGSWTTFQEIPDHFNQMSSNFQFNRGFASDNSSYLGGASV